MLFGYPVAATQNNWLHDCLWEAVHTIHSAVDAGKGYPVWPKILADAYRVRLKSRTGLRDRLKAYHRVIRKMEKTHRDAVLQALVGENRISDLVSGAYDCATIDELPEVAREPIEALFGFAFDELLTALDVRDQQYAAIYVALPDQVCPFCGTEPFDAPGTAREALDHYLTRGRYPFAAANLRNLVPMCGKCNSRYKLAKDLLHRPDGARRVAFDPYNHAKVGVSLDQSEPFGGTKDNTPKWTIHFIPDTAAVPTWDEVFSVRERYRRNHLDPSFSSWLRDFRNWARSAGIQTDSDSSLVAVLRLYEDFCAACGMQDRAFLKAAVFRMLRRHCEAGHQRLLDQLRDLVTPQAPPVLTGTLPPSVADEAA